MLHQILCVGQSDSSGISDVQADSKTVYAFGGYALNVVTAVTAKNTQGYADVRLLDEEIVRAQFDTILDDYRPVVMKTGLLASAGMINLVSAYAERLSKEGVKIVVDPVMQSKTGKVLLDKEARDALKRSLILVADVLVANVHEAEELTGMHIRDVDDMRHAAEMLITLGPKSVVLRGGDLASVGLSTVDIVATEESLDICQSDRVSADPIGGVGATMTTAIAMGVAEGKSLLDAYDDACVFVNKAMEHALEIGKGPRTLNHCDGVHFINAEKK